MENKQYDLDYFEVMLRQNSGTAEKICKVRWDLVMRFKPKVVLDYGSGCGWFRAFRPKGVEVDTFDIGKHKFGKFPQTGICHDHYDMVCFWDTLEHIPNFAVVQDVLDITDFVVLSIPIPPVNVMNFNIEDWKHFKPGEHLHYFTEATLDAFWSKLGFEKVFSGSPECPPRQDIITAVYAKKR